MGAQDEHDSLDLAARSRLAAMLDALPDLLFEVGLDGRYFDYHSPRTDLLAAPPEQLLGRTIDEVLPPDAAAVCHAALQEAHATGRSLGRQFELSLPQGRCWFELSVATLPLPAGEAPRFIVVSRDITERKRTEEALRASQAQLEAILASTADGILAVDTAGRVILTNRRLVELWQIPEELLDRRDEAALMAHLCAQLVDPEAFLARLSALCGSDTETIDTVPFKDGRVFERLTAPMRSGGARIGRVCSFRDITERRRVTQALEAAREGADAANRAKSEFLANMSHEIRTPLNGLLGNIQLLELTHPTPEQRECLAAISASGSNLLSLVNDILDLSKLEANKVALEDTHFSLRRCLQIAVRMQAARIAGKGLTLEVDLPDDVPDALVGDELRFRQILTNLLGNALKFTSVGGITVAAAVVALAADHVRLEVSVRDTGVGIPPNLIEDIFSPFVQADSSTSRRYGGTGLGLSISRRLAEQMGGRLTVESVVGQGSTFRVVLPFQLAPAESTPRAVTTPPVPPASPAGRPLRALVADTDALNRMFDAALLERMGYAVTAVADPAAVLAALANEALDLLFLDDRMPLDGVLAVVRGMAGPPAVFVMATGAADDDARENDTLPARGIDARLLRPLTIRKLTDAHRRAFAAKQESE